VKQNKNHKKSTKNRVRLHTITIAMSIDLHLWPKLWTRFEISLMSYCNPWLALLI